MSQKKTLGIWTNPVRECDNQLEVLEQTVVTWRGRLEVGRLSAKWAWVSYFHQFWAKLKYGVGVNASTVKDLLN